MVVRRRGKGVALDGCARWRLWLTIPCFVSLLSGIGLAAESQTPKAGTAKTKSAVRREKGPMTSPAGMPNLQPEKVGSVAETSGLHGSQGISTADSNPNRVERNVTPFDARLEPPPVGRQPEATLILIPKRIPAPNIGTGVYLPDAGGAQDGSGPPPEASRAPEDAGRPVGDIEEATGDSANALNPPPKPLAPDAGPVGPVLLENQVLDQIRLELKRRMSVFQLCADGARRRGVETFRRLEATWLIGADGNIRALRIVNVTDPSFATCLQRVGNLPLAVKPGVDLTIPTPIVFVR